MHDTPTVSVEDKFNINLKPKPVGRRGCRLCRVGVAEHWCLRWLFRLSLVVAIGLSISVLLTVAFYTWNYCRKRSTG